VRNAIDDSGFLDQVIGIELLRFGSWERCIWPTKSSICRLNLKFESSAILTYFFGVLLSVRNAIDDSGFLDQVIGIELSSLGHCSTSWAIFDGPKIKETDKEEKRQRKRKRERERVKETKKEKEQEVRGNRVDLGQKDRLTLIGSLVDRA